MTLVIMAAGLGSRYGGGGSKQTDGLGPDGQMMMEYSVADALRAGFDRIVFIIRRSMAEWFSDEIRRRLPGVDIALAFQEFDSLPGGYTPPAERTKPFGTAHAMLCAKDAVNGAFAVINADDFYGREAFLVMARSLSALPPAGHAAMVAYRVENTLSENGGVTRGYCTAEGGKLRSVSELYDIHRLPGGRIVNRAADGSEEELDPNAPVSMNFWGFTPWIFERAESYLTSFLSTLDAGDIKSECLLPVMVDDLMKRGELSVDMLCTDAKWFGVTYREDKPGVQEKLKALHDKGEY